MDLIPSLSGLLDTITSLSGALAYTVIGLLSLGESGVMIGLFIPGEPVMLLGGFLVFREQAALIPMVLVAWGGTIAGDCFSFFVGRAFGPRVRSSRLGRRIGPEKWALADDYFDKHGPKAIFFGKFIGIFRALLPAVAGATHMSWRSYLSAAVPAGLVFAGGLVVVGNAAGSSWKVIEERLGQASLIVPAVLLAGFIAYLVFWRLRKR